ncbi:MAG: HAD-IA family hydrolase [Anaerolineaceae bacterium]|nr:HAD-IA family hydrolase [Anaerolineaceae bacterium]
MSLKAMLLDMDGTITRPLLDFPAIKREIGIPAEAYILEVLEAMTPLERERAMQILERHEGEAAERSELNDGIEELFAELRRRSVPAGVITRNSRQSAETVARRHGLEFATLVCRDSARAKPSPEGILLALERMKVSPAEAVYVGDHMIDIRAGRAAGTRTILVTNGRQADAETAPDFTVARPGEIVVLLDCLQGE